MPKEIKQWKIKYQLDTTGTQRAKQRACTSSGSAGVRMKPAELFPCKVKISGPSGGQGGMRAVLAFPKELGPKEFHTPEMSDP